MTDSRTDTIQDVVDFLNGTTTTNFEAISKKETYAWIQQKLIAFSYATLNKPDKGLVRQYLEKITGYSTPQITRLIRQYLNSGTVRIKQYRRSSFSKKYSNQDIILLAQTDSLHDFPNGCSLKKTLKRMFEVFGDKAFQRLSHISPAHIYNLRKDLIYRKINKTYEKTKPRVVNIGKRQKPDPQGRPGCIQADTVHQGDQDGEKGVCHFNMVDMVTQWQVMGAVKKITEAYLIPIVIRLLKLFPFIIFEFHGDNGGEIINRRMARLLNKLLIELTKSRPREPNDNALVETKNGSIIRKWIGYGFIPQGKAALVNDFYFGIFQEYVNFHRPCGFATTKIDKKGKVKKIYKPEDYQTPYEKFTSLPNYQDFLKSGIKPKTLHDIAMRYTDNYIAELIQTERDRLNRRIITDL